MISKTIFKTDHNLKSINVGFFGNDPSQLKSEHIEDEKDGDNNFPVMFNYELAPSKINQNLISKHKILSKNANVSKITAKTYSMNNNCHFNQ